MGCLSAFSRGYCVAINPWAVATIQRLPQRTIELIRPMPGMVSPRAAIRFRRGPRARRFRPEPRQRSSRGWLSAWFPAPAPRRLHRHRHCGRTRIGLGGENRARRSAEASTPWRRVLGMLPTVAGAAVRKSDVDAVFRTPSSCRRSCLGNRQARALLSARFGQRRAGLRPRANSAPPAHPSAKLAASAIVVSKTRARAIAVWLTQHQHVIAIAAQESGRPAGFLGNDRPAVIRDNRLAVLHGVTHGLVSR